MKISNIFLSNSLIILFTLTITSTMKWYQCFFYKDLQYIEFAGLSIIIIFFFIFLLAVKFEEIKIKKNGIQYNQQRMLFRIIGIKKKAEFIDFIYLQDLEIVHSMPTKIILRFFNPNGKLTIKKFSFCTTSKNKLIEFDKTLTQKMWGI